MSGLRGAVALLTRIPVAGPLQDEREIAKSVPWFPIVGAAVGVAIAAIYAGSLVVLSPFVAAVIAMSAGLVITGAFHEDGLGDVADAFWGGWDREQRIRILKDPRLGTFGVLAITVSLLIRVGVLSGLDGWSALALLPAAHALSRAFAIHVMAAYEPVAEGLGASYVRALSAWQSALGIFAGFALAVIAIGWWAAPGAVICWLGAKAVGAMAVRKIGGISGDVLGAVQQVDEILVLLMGSAAVMAGWSLSWWHP